MTHIVLIEDNPIDARLIQRVLSGMVTWIDDGQKALWFLRSLEAGAVEPPPSLVLLDLNLPKYDGLQVLAEFRKSPVGRLVPVILMSSITAAEIAELAEKSGLQAEACLQKAYGLVELEQFAGRIREQLELSSSEPRGQGARTAAA